MSDAGLIGPPGEAGEAGPQGETGEKGAAGPRGRTGASLDVARLISTIDTLRSDISAHKAALVVADRRSRWARTASLVGILVGIIGVAGGISGVAFGSRAQATSDDLVRARRDTQISGCVQANVTTQRTREALIAGVSLVNAPNPTRSAEQQAAADRFVDAYSRQVDAALPYRDCSQGGIAAYFARPPGDPATTTTTTHPG